MTPLEMLERLQQLWDELPEVDCRGKCQTCCGPIDMSPAERELIRRQGVEIQPLTQARVEDWEADRKFDRHGRPLWCNALNLRTGRCEVYDVRPTVCRLWGAAESMPCPHGCKPVRMLDDAETMDYLMRSMVVGGRFTEDERAKAAAIFRDPVVAEAMGRVMRGDHGAKDHLVREINERRGAEVAG